MELVAVDLALDDSRPIPAAVREFLEDAASRIDRFIHDRRDDPVVGFIPSDYEMVYRAVAALRDRTLGAGGNGFCEWGSGVGVATCLAATLGYDAVGIEIDPDLVRMARELARDHDMNTEFVCGSYVPDGHIPDVECEECHIMTFESGRAAYEELGLEADDFDVIFAYPWPGEDDVLASLFNRYAARGATLLTYHGQDGMMARRKK